MDLYKFRACNDNLFSELDDQYIHFSKVEGLNDPMEGIKNIYWQGDHVLWRNLLKHYFLCLHNIIGEGLYNTLEHDSLSKLNSSLNSFNVEEYLALQDNGDELLSKVNELFLGSQDIIECIDLISDQKIYKNELAVVLQAIGYYAITIIKQLNNHTYTDFHSFTMPPEDQIKSIINYPLINEKYFFIEDCNAAQYLRITIDFLKNTRKSSATPEITLITEFAISLSQKLNLVQKRFIPLKIPLDYINMLENISNDRISMSCFSKNYSNPAMWSHYTNNHKGVCLIFNCESLTTLMPEEFSYHEVMYNNETYEVNFFETLFSVFTDQQLQEWCIDKEGKKSDVYAEFLTNPQLYESTYCSNIKRKLKDWAYENECRIVHRALNDDKSTTFTYPSAALAGIIFGMKICPIDRTKILGTVLQKYVNISPDINFKFYQAYYSREAGNIEIFECKNIMELSVKLITRVVSG